MSFFFYLNMIKLSYSMVLEIEVPFRESLIRAKYYIPLADYFKFDNSTFDMDYQNCYGEVFKISTLLTDEFLSKVPQDLDLLEKRYVDVCERFAQLSAYKHIYNQQNNIKNSLWRSSLSDITREERTSKYVNHTRMHLLEFGSYKGLLPHLRPPLV